MLTGNWTCIHYCQVQLCTSRCVVFRFSGNEFISFDHFLWLRFLLLKILLIFSDWLVTYFIQMPVNAEVMYPHIMEGFLPVINLFFHLWVKGDFFCLYYVKLVWRYDLCERTVPSTLICVWSSHMYSVFISGTLQDALTWQSMMLYVWNCLVALHSCSLRISKNMCCLLVCKYLDTVWMLL